MSLLTVSWQQGLTVEKQEYLDPPMMIRKSEFPIKPLIVEHYIVNFFTLGTGPGHSGTKHLRTSLILVL